MYFAFFVYNTITHSCACANVCDTAVVVKRIENRTPPLSGSPAVPPSPATSPASPSLALGKGENAAQLCSTRNLVGQLLEPKVGGVVCFD